MTREEQIQQQADKYIGHPQEIDEDISITNKRNAFIDGFKCAKEKLEIKYFELFKKARQEDKQELIEKACRWLLKGGYFVNSNETIDDFKKAMENLK